MTAITDNHMLKIPTASQFLNEQVAENDKTKRRSIKNINEQIEKVFSYIREATNGEHHMKLYKEIRLSLDVEKDAIGMQEVLENLKTLGYKVSLFDVKAYDNLKLREVNENCVHSHDIFDTGEKGNCGKSFDERTYNQSINTLTFSKRVPKSWMILYLK